MNVQADLIARVDTLTKERLQLRERIAVIDAELRDCVAAARLYRVELNLTEPSSLRDGLTVREIVLHRLRQAGPEGVKASDMYDDCGPVHPKTVGMTLYRLKLDGLCKRNHRTWYAVL